MSDEPSIWFVFGLLAGTFIAGVVALIMFGGCVSRAQVAAHGCAHYDTQTGAWQWNTPAQGPSP